LKDLFVTQGIRKLALMFNPNNQLTCKLICESWHRTATECGVGPNIFQMEFTTYKCITTRSWITSLWEFLSKADVQIQRVDIRNRFRSPSDAYINQQVFAIKEWSDKEKIIFNMCRLYLHVELISDIITADGKSVRPHIWQGTI
jgi:hypothetical protein